MLNGRALPPRSVCERTEAVPPRRQHRGGSTEAAAPRRSAPSRFHTLSPVQCGRMREPAPSGSSTGTRLMQFGALDIHALPEGRFTVGLDKRFVPHAEGDPLPAGSLFVSVCPFLVRTPSETLLLDAGLGSWAEGRGTEVIGESLARHGVRPEDVTGVLLSHLHFDHAGGAITPTDTGYRPTFPNAEYVLQSAELEAEGYRDESARVRDLVAEVLEREGQMRLLDGDGAVTDEIEVEITGGHTGAHQLIRLLADGPAGGLRAVFAGDILAGPSQVTRRFEAKYDVNGSASQAWRDRLIAHAAEHGDLLLFYHSTGTPGAFVDALPSGAWRVEPADL
ncbi:MAG: MBL fold metallo-hydrolase [Bacteroidota bacterium]